MVKMLSAVYGSLRRTGWIIPSSGLLPLFMAAHFGHHLVNSLPIPLLPMIRQDFDLDYTRSGLLVSAFTLSYGLSQFPAGWLADRLGPRILLAVGISGVAAAGLLVGLAQSYGGMFVFLMAMGVTGGGYHPAAPPLISAAVAPVNRGRAMGLHMVGGSAPYFLAPLIAVVLAAAWGWRGAFIALALPTILFGAVFYRVLGRRLIAGKSARAAAAEAPPQQRAGSGRFHRLAPFIVLSTCTHALTFCVIAFIPLYLVDLIGLRQTSAAAFLSIFYSAGLWASLAGGVLSDRLGSVPVVLTVCLVTGPAVYLLNSVPTAAGVAGILFVLGICNYMRTPVSETYLVSRSDAGNRSTVLGLYFFLNIEGGGVLTPLMGLLIDRYGFRTTFTIVAGALISLALTCWIWLRSAEGWTSGLKDEEASG